MADKDNSTTNVEEETEEEIKEETSTENVGEEDKGAGEPIHGRDSDYVPFVTSLRASPFYQSLSSLVHWNDPVHTALVFGIGNFFFFLITYGEYSVLTLLSYLALSLILVCGLYANGMMLRAHFKKEKVENPFAAKLKDPYVATKFTLEPHADSMIGLLNDTIELARSVLYFTDNYLSLKVAFVIWILSVVGNLFSGLTLLYMVFLTSFIWPRIYQEKQHQIDQAYELAWDKINFYANQALEKLPFGKKKKSE